MIRFSIITITYNAEAHVGRTLDSVLRQSYEGVEHILIDGASTDGTLALLRDYKQRSDADGHHKVIVKSEPDHGIYDAMNKGLTQAGADYVLFLNAGDCLPRTDTLATIVSRCRLVQRPTSELPAVLYGQTLITDGEGNVLRPRHLSAPDHLDWHSFRQGMLVCHQAFYARTDIAKNLQYDTRLHYSADVDWCIRVLREADRMALSVSNVGDVVAHYMEEGQTTRHHRASLIERFRVMTRHYGLITTIAMHLWFVIRALKK